MAAGSRIAKRYAKSLIGLAKEQDAVDQLNEDMKGFVQIAEDSHDFVLMLQSPIIKHDKKLEVLMAMFDGKVSDISIAFFKLLSRKGREAALPAIAKAYTTFYNEDKGLAVAEITTAAPLSESFKKDLATKVSKAVNKTVELEETINADLIGGFILRMDDKQIDNSVKTQLLNIKKRLN